MALEQTEGPPGEGFRRLIRMGDYCPVASEESTYTKHIVFSGIPGITVVLKRRVSSMVEQSSTKLKVFCSISLSRAMINGAFVSFILLLE